MLTPKIEPFYETKDKPRKDGIQCPSCGASSNDHGIYQGGENVHCTKCKKDYVVKKGLEK